MELIKNLSRKQLGLIALAIFLLFAIGFSGHLIQKRQAEKTAELISKIQQSNSDLETVTNKNQTLKKSLDEALKDKDQLLKIIADMESEPTEIEYITKTVTKLAPTEPIIITPTLPEEYLFQLNNNIPVARFSQENQEYKFETYTLDFENTLVISENETSVILEVKSSANNEWIQVPTNVTTTRITDHIKMFKPNLGLGFSLAAPEVKLTPTITLSAIHLSDKVDVASIYVSGNTKSIRFGVFPIEYNVGKHLPLVDDIWVAPGISYSSTGTPGADLTISTKL